MEIINASGKVGIDFMMKLFQRVFDRKGMAEDWKINVMVPIYMRKDVMNFGAYRGVKLLKHGMKIIERVLEKRIRALVEMDDLQFGFMPGRRTTNALIIVKRMQDEYMEKDKKLYACFMDLEKAFDTF